MENASKALLIGAAILFTVMILSLLMIGYQQISSYFTEKHEVEMIEQTTKFNSQFENYNQKSIRGSDMISFMNKVIDYNERLSYMEGTNYKRLEITIDLISSNIVNQLKYTTTETGFSNLSIFPTSNKITNVTSSGTPPTDIDKSRNLDKQLISITGTINELKDETQNGGIQNVTDTKLQSLASNISNIFLSLPNPNNQNYPLQETDGVKTDVNDRTSLEENIVTARQKRNDLIKNILGVELTLNNKGIVNERDKLNNIKEMTFKYYQITQFKRAYFECVSTEYDKETGRILKMNFKVKTDGNTIIFN